MGCSTCKSECGREDGCGTRKAAQKVVLDGLVARLYPGRSWGDPDPAESLGAGLSGGEVRRLGQALSVALKAPVRYVPGEEEDQCRFLYVLCQGREPSLLDLREDRVALEDLGAPDGGTVLERHLRIACSRLGRLAAVQEVALELRQGGGGAPDGMAVLRELSQPGVFDPKLLKRFQKAVDLLLASGIEHLDMGLLDVPAEQFGLTPGDYGARYGAAPRLFNYLFAAQPVVTTSSTYLPLP